MGGPEDDLDVETGAEAVLKIVDRLSPAENGKFLNIHVKGWEWKMWHAVLQRPGVRLVKSIDWSST